MVGTWLDHFQPGLIITVRSNGPGCLQRLKLFNGLLHLAVVVGFVAVDQPYALGESMLCLRQFLEVLNVRDRVVKFLQSGRDRLLQV